MGNVLKVVPDFGHTLVHGSEQENLLLQKLSELHEVELWRVHWALSQNLLKKIPPIPPHWLWSADTCRTAEVMQECYHEEAALKVLTSVLRLIGKDSQVHLPSPTIQLPAPVITQEFRPDFVRIHRRLLISRMQHPNIIIKDLIENKILSKENRDAISIYAICEDKARALVDLVLWMGEKAQERFYYALSQSEPFLLKELGDDPLRDKNSPETSVLSDMLEFLTTDEFRCFQWLVKDHMTKDALDLFDGEQLECADRQATQFILEKHFGLKQAETIAQNVLLRIVPVLSVCLPGDVATSQRSSFSARDADPTPVEVTSEVYENGNMFRLIGRRPGVAHCSLTGLRLEGFGDVVYEMVPWDVEFLSSKGLRPAGPLYKFRLLTGHFHRLHLPHCQLPSDGGQSFLSVAHITGDHMKFLHPVDVTDSHVIVDVLGFSCFGLVTSMSSMAPINGLVLLFSKPVDSSLFVLLLPRNVSLTQVQKEWKRRIGAEYVEAIPDCELIPNQSYKLSGTPVTVIQPESSKFVNFTDYNNFLPSFQVQLANSVSKVELHLRSEQPLSLIGWLFGCTPSVAWSRVVQLSAAASASPTEESMDVSIVLIEMLKSLESEDFKNFQDYLRFRSGSIPVCRLEAADRMRTVELMVQQYHAEGAADVAIEILKQMNYNELADLLQKRLSL